MTYSQFTIEKIKAELGYQVIEGFGIFGSLPTVAVSSFLTDLLVRFTPLALSIDTEKARSEYIVAPILFELKSQLENQVSLFSGREFNVDAALGLTGFCDFLVSQSTEQLMIEAPVLALVEAKNDNIASGLGQCMAEMIAAQMFNQQKGHPIELIYGVVTTGTNWKFMRLRDRAIELDLNEYFLGDLAKLFGILQHCVGH
ncbi:MAG: hypothetical protein RLZZ511_3156 [Cyanobacteriota bacterium]|jgi:hypothetical protein